MFSTSKFVKGALVLSASLLFYSTVGAQSATGATWTSRIRYQNYGSTSGMMSVAFYAESGTSYSSSSIGLVPYQSGDIYVGTVGSLPAGFEGSGVLSSDVPINAVYIQYSAANDYNPMISESFAAAKASATLYLPSIVRAYGQTSRVGIQNIGSSPVTVNMTFNALAGFSPATITPASVSIPAYSSLVFVVSEPVAGIPTNWAGSLVISATGGTVVASAQETDDNNRGAKAFEAIASGSSEIYIPTAICNYYNGQNTYYAIQAVGGAATVNITHQISIGSPTGTYSETGVSIASGGIISIDPCKRQNGTSFNYTGAGSTTITATSGSVIGVVKNRSYNQGFVTGYMASSLASGGKSVSLPYVVWDDVNTGVRTNMSVMNVGSAPSTVTTVSYYNNSGTLVGTHQLGALPAKGIGVTNVSNTPAGNVDFDGSVVVTSDQPVVVTNRTAFAVSLNNVTRFAEDYNSAVIAP